MNIPHGTEFPWKSVEESPALTLEGRIIDKNNIGKQRESFLDYYANLLFRQFDSRGSEITQQKKFVQIRSCFFRWIDLFSSNYALFTDPRQTLPYVFSNIGNRFSVLASPMRDGYARKEIEQSFDQSLNPQLYILSQRGT